jgi:hypothetical protein
MRIQWDSKNTKDNLGVYINAISLDEFMKEDPPCKECLIQGMCIKQITNIKFSSLRIEICEKFKEYLEVLK